MNELKFDFEQMTIGDLSLLMQISSDSAGNAKLMPDIISLLDRVTVDGVKSLPASRLTGVMEAFTSAYAAQSNPQTPAG
jgi:hypothetical protein